MADRYDDRYRGEDWRRERGYGRDDRGFMERAGDEVRSWFGDEEAERRRRMDEARYGRDWDRNRWDRERWDRDRGTRWTGGYNERGPFERGSDEVRSWFGDDEAERRRRMDEARYGRDWDRYGRDWDRYGRDWDYGHRMGFDYGRERGWGSELWGAPERYTGETARIDYWRPRYGYGTSGYREYGGHSPGYRDHEDTGRYGQGWFAGRGPRGYQRSDERIREDVCDRLTDDWSIDASDIDVTVRTGEVTLSGTVRERDDKRRAEDAIERISGVREVHNNLRVAGTTLREGMREQQGTTTTGTTAGTPSRR